MTIRDIEALSGMTRANIRYYEQEGLLSPKRASNGYREYSEDDLKALKRIKLLRSLDITLKEIKELQSGAARLTDTLTRRIDELEQVRQDAAFARDICRVMREDQATYATLDADKYLDVIPQTAKTGSFKISSDTVPPVSHPWRRYFARMLDISIYSTAWAAVLALCLHINLTRRSGILDYLDIIIAALLMLFLEPLLLRLFGTTPGKWIFGLYLEDETGRRPDYGAGLFRTWGVIGAGLGYYIPIYNLVRLWKSYKRCRDNEPEPWEDELVYSIRDTKWYRAAAFVAACGVLFAALVLITNAAPLPPNRGELTVAEFAENYNALAAYYGIESGRQLDPEGKWVRKSEDGTAYINVGYTPAAEFEYTVENGYLTGIRYEIAVDDNPEWLIPGSNEMILAGLSFVGAQDEAGIFSGIREKLVKEISGRSLEDFTFVRAGVRLVCDVEFSGYNDYSTSQGILIPLDGAETHFYRLFSLNKTGG
jgi:DNA-binding transcriptional MerR regulator/uncharacterized RDD family membrane protein YckC